MFFSSKSVIFILQQRKSHPPPPPNTKAFYINISSLPWSNWGGRKWSLFGRRKLAGGGPNGSNRAPGGIRRSSKLPPGTNGGKCLGGSNSIPPPPTANGSRSRRPTPYSWFLSRSLFKSKEKRDSRFVSGHSGGDRGRGGWSMVWVPAARVSLSKTYNRDR